VNSEIYLHAKYYEIAFDFTNIPKQIDLFEEFMQAHSLIPVKSVLDMACGPSKQLREFARRGYKAIGLDMSDEMLAYLGERAAEENVVINTVKADMHDFELAEKVDFAYILMGSISYMRDNTDFINQLKSVAASLNTGGLFIIENLRVDWASPEFWREQTWNMNRGLVSIDTTHQLSLIDELNQIIEQFLKLEVNDAGVISVLEEKVAVKHLFPKELKTIVELEGSFEFVGFFERSAVKQLSSADSNNLVVMRRR